MNALNINSYHSLTKFLQPANLTTYTILSLSSLQVELAPRLLSPWLWDCNVGFLWSQGADDMWVSDDGWQASSPTSVTLARQSVSPSLQITNRSFTYASPYLWNQLPSSFPQLFTVLLVHLILRISPHHIHHLHSHHLSLPLPSTPDLKLISFTNPFVHSHSCSFRTMTSRILTCTEL